MAGPFSKPLTTRPFDLVREETRKITTWGSALQFYRIERKLSVHELADRVGVSRRDLEAWEAGTEVPSRQQLKRLYASVSRLRSMEPLYHRVSVRTPISKQEPEVQDAVTVAPPPPQPPPAPPKQVPAPAQEAKTSSPDHRMGSIPMRIAFGRAVKAARTAAGLTQFQLAQLLCEDMRTNNLQTSVSHWETGAGWPMMSNYKKLLLLFPSLANMAVALDEIRVDRTNDRASVEAAVMKPAAASSQKALPPSPPLPDMAVIGTAFAKALGEKKAAHDALVAAQAALIAAEIRVKDADAAADKADQALREAAAVIAGR